MSDNPSSNHHQPIINQSSTNHHCICIFLEPALPLIFVNLALGVPLTLHSDVCWCSQVDPSVDLASEESAVHRALQSVFGMMEKTARVGCEQAEQLATSVVAAAAAAATATAAVDPSATATACSPYDSVKRAVRCNQLAISASGCLTALAAMAATVGQLVREAPSQVYMLDWVCG